MTGGTGSFGQFIVRRLLDHDVAEIRILSRDEKKHYDMRHHYAAERRIKFVTGDILATSGACEKVCEVARWCFKPRRLRNVDNGSSTLTKP